MATSVEFQHDTGDPSHVYTWTVPAGVTWVQIESQGGGTWDEAGSVGFHGDRGLYVQMVPVEAGDVLGFLLGGAADDTTGGYHGGGDGGGGISLVGIRGYGGGGRNEITLNGDLWMVVGGDGGAVAASVAGGPDIVTIAAPQPGPATEPRAPAAAFPTGPGYTTLDFYPGLVGGTDDGADGVSDGGLFGSGGGGSGWGGGASGFVHHYEVDIPPDPAYDTTSSSGGKSGGHLIPADAVFVAWGAISHDVPDNAGQGWARITYDNTQGGRWALGAINFNPAA